MKPQLIAILFSIVLTSLIQSESLAQVTSRRNQEDGGKLDFGSGSRTSQAESAPSNSTQSNSIQADQEQASTNEQIQDPDELIWGDETLPDWLEESGLEENDSPQGEDLPTRSQQAQSGMPPNPFGSLCDPIRIRPTLGGDWGGLRTDLMQNGIVYRGRFTQYLFGVGGGVNAPIAPPLARIGVAPGDSFRYTGTARHDVLVDLDKFGGPQAGKFILTTEGIFGTYANVSKRTGALAPVFGSFSPVDPKANFNPRVTNFFYIQPLSKNLIVGMGKLRLPGVADQDVFAGGDGSDQFVNQTFAVNPMFISLFPISSFACTVVMPQEWGNISLAIIDPQERSTDFFDIGDVFSQGAIVQTQFKVNTNFFGLPGDHHLGGIYKEVDLLDLSLTPVAPPYPTYPYPDAPPGFATKSSSWAMYYGFDQYVNVFGEDARGNRMGWGFFGRAGLADSGNGNPNIVGWHASMGIGGNSPLLSRREKGDQFGFGYSFLATSNEWGPAAFALIGPRDYQAMEAFYRFQITPAISVTPDIQWIQGKLGGPTDFEDAIVFGMRMNVQL